MAASRAWVKARPSSPSPAERTWSVTSEMPVKTSACIPSQRRSSSRVAGRKPVRAYWLSAVDRAWTQASTQWLLVRTSPSAETIDAEQPVDSRIEAAWTRSSQARSIDAP